MEKPYQPALPTKPNKRQTKTVTCFDRSVQGILNAIKENNITCELKDIETYTTFEDGHKCVVLIFQEEFLDTKYAKLVEEYEQSMLQYTKDYITYAEKLKAYAEHLLATT